MSWQVVVGRLLGREPGPSLLISGFTALYWYWPRSGTHQIVHHLAGRYYGVAYGASDGELLVVSRPDQGQDDALLQVPAAGGEASRRWPLASRDTHQAVRDGRRLYVTDTHRGRVLEYELPTVRLTRSFAPFTHEDHINSLRVFEGHLYVLANRSGPSQLIQLCLEQGEIVQVYDAVGRGAHDIVPWGESFLVLDSLSGGASGDRPAHEALSNAVVATANVHQGFVGTRRHRLLRHLVAGGSRAAVSRRL